MQWLDGAYRATACDPAPLEGFKAWVHEELIVEHRLHPSAPGPSVEWCGLSLFVPRARAVRGRYQDYPLRSASQLDLLWQVMYPAGRVEGF